MSNTTMLIILVAIFILSGVVIWLSNRGTGPAKVEDTERHEEVEERREEKEVRAREKKRDSAS